MTEPSAFWNDLAEDLKDPEFRAEFERTSAELGSVPPAPVERDEDTYLLALQSIDRWGRRYRVSPAMRLRAIRAVVDAALSQSDV